MYHKHQRLTSCQVSHCSMLFIRRVTAQGTARSPPPSARTHDTRVATLKRTLTHAFVSITPYVHCTGPLQWQAVHLRSAA